MNIKEILAKVAKGETLTDEEKAFLGGYDPQADIDKASAAARRKAEKERDDALAKAAKAAEDLEAAQTALNNPQKDDQLAKLAKEVEKLTKKNAEAEAKLKATARMEAIRAAAKANGAVAAEGISAEIFDMLLDRAVGEVDVGDADALKGALEAFKSANPAMIADLGKGGVGGKGRPAGGAGATGGVNPWKEGSVNLTEQMRLLNTNPAEAQRLAGEAGVTLQL